MQHLSFPSNPPQFPTLSPSPILPHEPSPARLVALDVTGAAMRQFLCQFDKEIDGLVYLYLLSVARDDRVYESVYTMARQLGFYRTTLSRILSRLEERQAITITTSPCADGGEKTVIVLPVASTQQKANVTSEAEDVTSEAEDVTSELTNVTSEAEDVTSGGSSSSSETVGRGGGKDGKTLSDSGMAAGEGMAGVRGGGDAMTVARRHKKKNKEEKAPVTQKEENKIKTPHPHARATTMTLEQRRRAFVDSLVPFAEKYGRAMTQAFADYWTEPNRSLTRMRFEMQRTWSLPLRLATWARNDRLFAQRMASVQRPSSSDCVAQAQQWAMEETERLVRKAEQTWQEREQRFRDYGIVVDDEEGPSPLPF